MIVYTLSHPITGEVRYVGKSKRGIYRTREHGLPSTLKKTSKRPISHWIKKLRRQGLDYVVEVIEECDSIEALNEAEKFYIGYFRFLGFGLLNICAGGEGGGPLSDEAKKKISDKNIEWARKNGRLFMDQLGNVYFCQSEAARRLGISQGNISAILRGKRLMVNGYRFFYPTSSTT